MQRHMPGVIVTAVLCGMLAYAARSVSADDVHPGRAPDEAVFAAPRPSTDDILRDAADQMRESFDAMLAEPDAYRDRALRECKAFPEGRIYSFAIPAMAYTNLALDGRIDKADAKTQVRKLIRIAIPIVADKAHAPRGDLMRLTDYAGQGCFISSLNLMLANYALLVDKPNGDDRQLALLHDHLTGLLRRAVVSHKGAAIESYPRIYWYFDTIMAITTIAMYDRAHGADDYRKLFDTHLAWRRENATHSGTGLPRANNFDGPRGCDLSMQVCLLAQVDREQAKTLYDRYCAAHWLDIGLAVGFREYPAGMKRSHVSDIDSGPVVLGVGATASGVGIGAAKSMNDQHRLDRLAEALHATTTSILPAVRADEHHPIRKWLGTRIPFGEDYYTGFLYGDAVLFYAVTWTPYEAEGARD